MQDWYEVPLVLVKEFGASHLLKQYRKIKDLLTDAYPSHTWPHILTCPRGYLIMYYIIYNIFVKCKTEFHAKSGTTFVSRR